MRVLIIQTSDLAEVVYALPVIDYLKQASAGIEIDWVAAESVRPILEGNAQLSALYSVRTTPWHRRPLAADTWREVTALRAALQERAYDLVFDLQGSLRSGFLGLLTGCGDRIGFDRDDLEHPVNALFSTRRIPLRRQDQHAADRCLRLVSVPFARDFRTMTLSSVIRTSPEDDADAEALLATLSDGLVLLFHYGAACQTRRWSDGNWAELGEAVLGRFPDATILFDWGTRAEKDAVTGICGRIGSGARVTQPRSLQGLAALLKKVDLVVGGDSAPVHLAAVLGTPTVSFYRASDGRQSGPRGERHVVLQSPMHCARCLRTHCDKDPQCRDTIKVAAVLAGIEKLLAEPS
jgi:heptosyltransferase I